MLRITQQSSADAAKQYYTSADYYADAVGKRHREPDFIEFDLAMQLLRPLEMGRKQKP